MGERGALCILLMICIIGGAFLLGGLLFSQSVSTILQLVVALSVMHAKAHKWSCQVSPSISILHVILKADLSFCHALYSMLFYLIM